MELKLSSKIYSSLINLFKFACCWLILADGTVHDSQHAGRQMLHLSTEIELLLLLLAQSPSWEFKIFNLPGDQHCLSALNRQSQLISWVQNGCVGKASFQWANKACIDRRIIHRLIFFPHCRPIIRGNTEPSVGISSACSLVVALGVGSSMASTKQRWISQWSNMVANCWWRNVVIAH